MQQVNLYKPIFRKDRKWFTARFMLYGGGIVLIGLLLIHGWAQWQFRQGNERLALLEQQREERLAQLEEMQRLHPEPTADPRLQERLARLEERLRQRRRMLTTLAGNASGNREGFAVHLRGLARQRLTDLWLTRIAIRRGGEEMSLGGSTTSPEQLPRLLKRLGEEPVFRGMVFQGLRMDRVEETDRIDFTVRTVPLEPGDSVR